MDLLLALIKGLAQRFVNYRSLYMTLSNLLGLGLRDSPTL